MKRFAMQPMADFVRGDRALTSADGVGAADVVRHLSAEHPAIAAGSKDQKDGTASCLPA